MSENSLEKRRTRARTPVGARRGGGSTMNRPGADTLNSNAQPTAAAQAYAKELRSEREFKPAIATGIIPPVIDEKNKEAKKQPSPFKPAKSAPIKRPKNVTNIRYEAEQEAAQKRAAVKKNENQDESGSEKEKPQDCGPRIARFTPFPEIKKPESPFLPAGAQNNKTGNGLKAPIKRPASASVNHAAARKALEEEEKLSEDTGAEVIRKSEAALKSEPSRPLKPEEKTFVPLAPVPFFAEPNEVSPFAAPVEKTDEQRKKEEEAARRALEESRCVEAKKSRFGKLMDELNKPIF